VEKVEGEKILQRERERENRKKKMMERRLLISLKYQRKISFKSKMIIERVENKK